MSGPVDSDAVAPEPLDPASTGLGATGTSTAVPAPGSESHAMREPSESLGYLDRAASALMQAIGTAPSVVELNGDMLDALVLLVLVKGDRTTASDVHDAWAVVTRAHDPQNAGLVPFDALDPRSQQGLDMLVVAVQRAGRFMGRDGS